MRSADLARSAAARFCTRIVSDSSRSTGPQAV